MKNYILVWVVLIAQGLAVEPQLVWQKVWGYGSSEKIHGIVLDWPGYIYCTGESMGSYVLLSLQKYTTGGDSVWRTTYNNSSDAIGYGLVALPNHNLVVVGTEVSGGNPVSISLLYSASGTLLKSKKTPGYAKDGPPVVTARVSDSCYVGTWGQNSSGNLGQATLYLLDQTGEIAKTYSTSGNHPLSGMVIGSMGSIYVGQPPCEWDKASYDLSGLGYKIYLGDGTLNTTGVAISSKEDIYFCGNVNSGQRDFFLFKWDTTGNYLWTTHKSFNLGGDDWCLDMALDSISDCCLTGYQVRGEEEDAALVKTDSAGNLLWKWVDTLPGKQEIEAIEVDPEGYLYLAGSENTGTGWDAFVIKVSQPLEISGIVKDSTGKAMKDFTLALTGDTALEVTTDNEGRYNLVVYNGGNYTLKPKQSGWVFEPSLYSYSPLAHRMIDQDFLDGKWSGIEEHPIPSQLTLDVDDAGVRFSLPQSSYVSLAVYDVCGRQTAVLAQGTFGVGNHTVKKPELEQGVYFVKLDANNVALCKKLISLR